MFRRYVILTTSLLFIVLWIYRSNQFEIALVKPADSLSPVKKNDQSSEQRPNVNREPQTSHGVTSKEDRFLQVFPGSWKFSFDQQRNISSVVGGKIKVEHRNAKEVLRLARKMAPLLGVDEEQIAENVIQPAGTRFGENYRMVQEIEGIQVYDSFLQFYVSKKTNSIRIIDSQLKPIRDVEMMKQISLDEAVEIVLRQKQDYKLEKPGGPVIYPNKNKGELAYQIFVYSNDDDREFIISAQTGDILFSQSTRIH